MTTAVILAGGLGTRLRDAVPELPKPMAPVSGRPFLEHLLDYWIGQGIDRFLLSVGYKSEAIQQHFGTAYAGIPVDYAVEQEPLGTGGGVFLAAQKVSGDSFLLLNGDTYFAVDRAALTACADRNNADWCFSVFRAGESGRYMGMQIRQDGWVTAMKSESGKPGGLANGGVYWIRRAALDVLAENPSLAAGKVSLEDNVFPAALRMGQRIFAMESSGDFIDIGVPRDYHGAAEVICSKGA